MERLDEKHVDLAEKLKILKLAARKTKSVSFFDAAEEKAETDEVIGTLTKEAAAARDELAAFTTHLAAKTGATPLKVLEATVLLHKVIDYSDIRELLVAAQSADICFVLDATGSMLMDGAFTCLTNKMRGIMGEIKKDIKQFLPMMSMVAYRDPEDRHLHLEVAHFTGSFTTIQERIGAVKASGGGDQCEDVIGALDAASKLDWQQVNRVLFLCGDAPCHGRQFHDDCQDSHPDGLKSVDIKAVLKSLIEKQVQIVFWRINATTDKMIRVFNKIASTFEEVKMPGKRPREEYIVTVPLATCSAEAMAESIKKSVSESISISISSSMSRASHKSVITYSVSKVAKMIPSITVGERSILVEACSIDPTEDTVDAVLSEASTDSILCADGSGEI